MTTQYQARAVVALAAAYALALQAILLAVAVPLGAQTAGFGGLPICSGLDSGYRYTATNSAPRRHTGSCPGGCLGCCCSPPACHLPGPVTTYAPVSSPMGLAAARAMQPIPIGQFAAHRSRAPPLA
jgi:hypothetical protein